MIKTDFQTGDREFATVYMAPPGPGQPPRDVAMELVSAGWARCRDGVGEGDEAVRLVVHFA